MFSATRRHLRTIMAIGLVLSFLAIPLTHMGCAIEEPTADQNDFDD